MKLVNGKTRINLRNILFATDFSSPSETALAYAMGIARRYDSQLYVAHVIRPDAYQLVPPEAVATTLEQTRRYAEQQMADLLISGRLRGVPHQVLMGHGELWPVLLKMIQEHEVDLVVVGTHGRTGVRKLLLGSVAEEIFRLAPCPVLTVGPKVAESPSAEASLQCIVYATDFSPNSEAAAGYAVSLAQEHQAHLTLLHVVRDVAGHTPGNMSRLRHYFNRRFSELIPEDADPWCEPEFALEFGDPADTILRTASERKARLIVMGVRQTGAFPGHLPPATAYKVVCQAFCPVLTIRG